MKTPILINDNMNIKKSPVRILCTVTETFNITNFECMVL